MAKSQTARVVGTITAAAVTLSAALKSKVAGMKAAAQGLAAKYGEVREKVNESAPRFMALFNEIKQAQDNPDGFGLADFARLFDSTVPTHAADNNEGVGYRNHRMYYTLAYMQRVQRQKDKPRGTQGKFNGASAKLERLIATLLTVAKDPAPLWERVSEEFAMQPRTLAILKNRVEQVQPIMDLTKIMGSKKIDFSAAPAIHMERTAAGSGGEAGDATSEVEASATRTRAGIDSLAQSGRRVRRSA